MLRESCLCCGVTVVYGYSALTSCAALRDTFPGAPPFSFFGGVEESSPVMISLFARPKEQPLYLTKAVGWEPHSLRLPACDMRKLQFPRECHCRTSQTDSYSCGSNLRRCRNSIWDTYCWRDGGEPFKMLWTQWSNTDKGYIFGSATYHSQEYCWNKKATWYSLIPLYWRCLKMAKASHERQRLFQHHFRRNANRVQEKTALKVLLSEIFLGR